MAPVATFLALTIDHALVARRAHLASALWRRRSAAAAHRAPPAAAEKRARAAGPGCWRRLAFLLQLACFVYGWRTVGAAAQAALILGAWAYVAVLWLTD